MRKAIEILENSNNNNNNNSTSINFKTFNNDMILIYTSKIISFFSFIFINNLKFFYYLIIR